MTWMDEDARKSHEFALACKRAELTGGDMTTMLFISNIGSTWTLAELSVANAMKAAGRPYAVIATKLNRDNNLNRTAEQVRTAIGDLK